MAGKACGFGRPALGRLPQQMNDFARRRAGLPGNLPFLLEHIA
jgi:hypothetical protein